MTSTPQSDEDEALARDLQAFSYSYPGDPWWKRLPTRIIEIATGQPYFVKLYLQYRREKRTGESFFAAGLRLLKIGLVYDAAKLAAWPQEGPLVVICNHPFGVIDGLAICHLVSQRRGDFMALTNAVLDRAAEFRAHMLPIDFAETKQARQVNLESRAAALAHLKSGGCIIVFPAGGVATTPHLFATRAVDEPWKHFPARLVLEAKAHVAPVFIPGQNSMWFQIASHISLTLRLALMFREARAKVGSRVEVHIGDVIPFAATASQDRIALIRHLRRTVEQLRDGGAQPLAGGGA
jgi:putative hemolysin